MSKRLEWEFSDINESLTFFLYCVCVHACLHQCDMLVKHNLIACSSQGCMSWPAMCWLSVCSKQSICLSSMCNKLLIMIMRLHSNDFNAHTCINTPLQQNKPNAKEEKNQTLMCVSHECPHSVFFYMCVYVGLSVRVCVLLSN